jgi:ribosomal-protein-alanine N-acetyltransferase
MDAALIQSERFFLRGLTESDATERYWSWLQDPDARKYITAAAQTQGIADLRRYISERVGREDVLFLGIFDKAGGSHIGNIKYEPVDSRASYAIMGVLIGEPAYRGQGVTGEVLEASARWLQATRGIRQIVLGVSTGNQAAIRAYEKAGFVAAPTPHIPRPIDGTLTMVWDL